MMKYYPYKNNYEPFFCLVVGSRSFTDYELFESKMNDLLKNKSNIIIVSGGAKGTDSLAKRYAVDNGYLYREFPADWKKHGKRAGYIRNEEMHAYISKQTDRNVVVFWDGKSKGSTHSFSLAEKYNNPIKIEKI